MFQFLKVDRSALSAKAKVGLRMARGQEAKPKLDRGLAIPECRRFV